MMLKWLIDFMSVLEWILIWGSFLVGLGICITHGWSIFGKKKGGLRNWCGMLLGGLFVALFLFIKIAFPLIFDLFWGCLFVMVIMISWIFAQYEDCRNYKRWWNR